MLYEFVYTICMLSGGGEGTTGYAPYVVSPPPLVVSSAAQSPCVVSSAPLLLPTLLSFCCICYLLLPVMVPLLLAFLPSLHPCQCPCCSGIVTIIGLSLAIKHPNAFLSWLQPSRSCWQNLCREGEGMAQFQNWYHCFPFKVPRGPHTYRAHGQVWGVMSWHNPHPMRERPANRWISDKTWMVIIKWATMRRQGHLTTSISHWIGCKIIIPPCHGPQITRCKCCILRWEPPKQWCHGGGMVHPYGVVQVGRGPSPTHVPQNYGQTDGQIAWNCMLGLPPWGQHSHIISRTLQFLMTCPWMGRCIRWWGGYRKDKPQGWVGQCIRDTWLLFALMKTAFWWLSIVASGMRSSSFVFVEPVVAQHY